MGGGGGSWRILRPLIWVLYISRDLILSQGVKSLGTRLCVKYPYKELSSPLAGNRCGKVWE